MKPIIENVTTAKDLKDLYWETIIHDIDLKRYVDCLVDWNSSVFVELFLDFWWVWRVSIDGRLVGLVTVRFYEGELPELAYWALPELHPWITFSVGRVLILEILSELGSFKVSHGSRSNLRLAKALGAQTYDERGAVWVAESSLMQSGITTKMTTMTTTTKRKR